MTGPTIKDAELAAYDLGSFTRAQLAERLNCSPLAVGKWLTRMTEERGSVAREGRIYTWVSDAEREAEPKLPEFNDCRVAARALGKRQTTFTVADLAEALAVSEQHAAKKVKWLIDHDIIRFTGKTQWREVGKRPALYEVVPFKPEQNGSRPKRAPAEIEVREKGMLREPAPTGNRPLIRHQELRELVDAIYDAGGTVSKAGKHLKVMLPGVKEKITMAATPGSSGIPKTRAMLRRYGLKV